MRCFIIVEHSPSQWGSLLGPKETPEKDFSSDPPQGPRLHTKLSSPGASLPPASSDPYVAAILATCSLGLLAGSAPGSRVVHLPATPTPISTS